MTVYRVIQQRVEYSSREVLVEVDESDGPYDPDNLKDFALADAIADASDALPAFEVQSANEEIAEYEAIPDTTKPQVIEPPEAALKLRDALEAYWRSKDLWYDAKWYTPAEWEARGERYGAGAHLHLTFEGPLYREFNDGGPKWEVREHTIDIEQEHDYWHELGFAWSMHFYPVEKR